MKFISLSHASFFLGGGEGEEDPFLPKNYTYVFLKHLSDKHLLFFSKVMKLCRNLHPSDI